MARTGLRPLPAVLLAATCLVALASVSVSLGREAVYDAVLYPLQAVAWALAGALITSNQPGNVIGRVLCALGVESALTEFTEGYGYHTSWLGAGTSQWLTSWGTWLGIGAVAVVLTLFPSARDLTPGRRVLLGAGVLAMLLNTLEAAFGHSLDNRYTTGSNPYALGDLSLLHLAGQVLFTVVLLAAIGSLVVRVRRSTGVERRQLAWVVYVVALLAVIAPAAIFWYDDSPLVRVAIAVVVTALPIAICIAILRHRLYDIDVLVNRTVVYGSVTLLLASCYLATALVLGAALGGSRSPWVTAAATLAVAVAFRPLRTRVQDAVDRRFRRARYDARRRVDAFLDDLRAGRAEPESLQDLLRELTGQPDLELRYIAPGDEPPAGTAAGNGRAQLLVAPAGVPLAVVVHDTADETSAALLREAVTRAGLAVEIGRLRGEVQQRLAEVEASRARIVTAGYQERRRLERDLHDGAQQRLLSVGLALRHAQVERGSPPAGSPAAATLDAAIDQIAVAIAELRELANGIRPAYLDHGLVVALRELAGRAPLPVVVAADPDRYPTDVEATAYFVACEGLTNAVKHAAATKVEVQVRRLDGHVVLTVGDDGVGGAQPDRGSGLRGLADRVAAHGGRIHVESRQGRGTVLTAELPCAS